MAAGWQWLVDLAGLCLLLLFCYAVWLLVRRRVLTRGSGTFELSYRAPAGRSGRGWVLGVGRYQGEALDFYRVFGLLLRPVRTFPREAITVAERRAPRSGEQHVLYAGHVVVECEVAGERVDLAMSVGALTGMLAWLEAAPPGRTPRTH
jgi:hypothetical protein